MSKLPHVGTTIFTVMSQLANETGAINLSQGFPNFPVDNKLVRLLKETADESYHQYMPMGGFPALQVEISQCVEQYYNRIISPSDNVLITAGATQAIFTSIMALVSKGDEVIILDPSYDCYEPAIVLAGGEPIRIPLNSEFLPDWGKINAAVNAKTKMIITNNPHNPSGRVWNSSDLDALENLMMTHEQLILLSDEVYEFITFEKKHISVNSIPSLLNRSIIVSSFGKTFHITGWKMGYIVAPLELMVEIKKVHQFNVFSVNSLAQATLAKYIPTVKLNTIGSFYQEKRDLFRSLLQNSRFELMECDGTYFQIASYQSISNEHDIEFCKKLTIDYGVAAIPISVFNKTGSCSKQIRFCFAKDDETLIQAADKLCKI